MSPTLQYFILSGKRHLDYLLREFVAYYNTKRASTVWDHLPPVRVEEPDDVPTLKLNDIEVKSYVGGLVKGPERRAAQAAARDWGVPHAIRARSARQPRLSRLGIAMQRSWYGQQRGSNEVRDTSLPRTAIGPRWKLLLREIDRA